LALPINELTKGLLNDTVKTPILILEIEGLPPFSSVQIKKYAVYGDDIVYGQTGLYYGGLINDNSSYPYIDLEKSTNQISQQLQPDKGGHSSTTSFDVALVDKDQVISRFISPGFVVDDILAKKAKIFLSFEGAGHPQDSILFFTGIISEVSGNGGLIKFSISSPEKLKSQEIFPKVTTELTSIINSSITTIPVTSTKDFLLPADSGTLKTYIRIEDEIIEYTGKTDTLFTGCLRGQLDTVASSHDIQSEVECFYRLQGNLRDLSLKLMLSGSKEFYESDITIVAFNTYGLISASNAIFIPNYNIDQTLGIVTGDTAVIIGSISNDGTYTIIDIVNTNTGSYIVVNSTINNEVPQGTISIKSKYNVLPPNAGLGMTPDQVDVAEFERVYNQFQSNFFTYDFYIKDQIVGSEFINTQILYPSGAYALPKAKTSLGLTIPPLAQVDTKKIDENTSSGSSKISIRRSINKNFYNAVVYSYEMDSIEDKYLRHKITQSADSTNRIKIDNKHLVIKADGVRSSAGFQFLFDTQTRRFLDRYKYAAEYLDVEVLFGTGFEIEIGDTVILDGRNLNIPDSSSGSRTFKPRLFEVQNKSFSLSGKVVKLSLVDTIYSLNARYGTILPSSMIDVGSTNSVINLKRSYGTLLGDSAETVKWTPYIGERVLFRNDNWTIQEESVIKSVNPTNPNSFIIDPPLTFVPDEEIIMEVPPYDNSSNTEMSIYKATGYFNTKSIQVVSGSSESVFEVSPLDVDWFIVGSPLIVHNDNYTRRSIETTVKEVNGNLVTTTNDLGIVPMLGDRVELNSFKDGGKPYRYL
jgi:hypothetical protein